MVENQHTLSSGLLYSVAPESFAALHLHEDESKDNFDWDAYEAELNGNSAMKDVIGFLRVTAAKWGMIKLN
jgi:hypothetical protein